MGKYLVINGADFSTNGIPVVDRDAIALEEIRTLIATNFRANKTFPNGNPNTSTSPNDSTTRCVILAFDALTLGLRDFVITPKAGYKIVPMQSKGTAGTAKFTYSWVTEATTFEGFSTYQYVAANLALTTDANIPSGASVWDFIDVTLAP